MGRWRRGKSTKATDRTIHFQSSCQCGTCRLLGDQSPFWDCEVVDNCRREGGRARDRVRRRPWEASMERKWKGDEEKRTRYQPGCSDNVALKRRTRRTLSWEGKGRKLGGGGRPVERRQGDGAELFTQRTPQDTLQPPQPHDSPSSLVKSSLQPKRHPQMTPWRQEREADQERWTRWAQSTPSIVPAFPSCAS